MKATDSLRRDDMTAKSAFEALPGPVQKALLKAVRHGSADLPEAIDRDWIMVPTPKKGLFQVGINGLRVFKF